MVNQPFYGCFFFSFLSVNGGQNFQGCISRVHFNSSSVNISPIKLYFDANKPSEMRGQGIITQSQCRVHNLPPPLLSKEPPVYSPTDPPPTETVPDAGSVLAPGDKATIAGKSVKQSFSWFLLRQVLYPIKWLTNIFELVCL